MIWRALSVAAALAVIACARGLPEVVPVAGPAADGAHPGPVPSCPPFPSDSPGPVLRGRAAEALLGSRQVPEVAAATERDVRVPCGAADVSAGSLVGHGPFAPPPACLASEIADMAVHGTSAERSWAKRAWQEADGSLRTSIEEAVRKLELREVACDEPVVGLGPTVRVRVRLRCLCFDHDLLRDLDMDVPCGSRGGRFYDLAPPEGHSSAAYVDDTVLEVLDRYLARPPGERRRAAHLEDVTLTTTHAALAVARVPLRPAHAIQGVPAGEAFTGVVVRLRPVVSADRRFVTLVLGARAARVGPSVDTATGLTSGAARIALAHLPRYVVSLPDEGTLLVSIADPVFGHWDRGDQVVLMVTARIEDTRSP